MTDSCCMVEAAPCSGDRRRSCSEVRDWSRLDDQFFRINVSLVNVVSNLQALPRIMEDLEDDPVKASKKQMEFSTRFTRNYLCELRQKMNDIRKIIEQSENENSHKNQAFFNCFLSSFQTAYQAFQNIEKNLKYVIFNKMPPQISEFLSCFGDLCMIANAAYWEESNDKLFELEQLNTAFINKLNDIENNTRKAEIQKKEKQKTILKFKADAKKPPPLLKPKRESKSLNYSMYKSAQVNNFEKLWKKKTRLLAEARFGNKTQFQSRQTDKDMIQNERSTEKVAINEEKNKPKENPTKPEVKEETTVRKRKTKPVPENEMETMIQSVTSVTSESEQEEDGSAKIKSQVVNVTTEVVVKDQTSQEKRMEAEDFPMGPVLDEAFKTMFNHIMSQVMTNIDPEKREPEDLELRNSVAQEVRRSNFREDNVKLICIVEDETANSVQVNN